LSSVTQSTLFRQVNPLAMDEMFVSKCTMNSHVSACNLYIYMFKADKKFVTFE